MNTQEIIEEIEQDISDLKICIDEFLDADEKQEAIDDLAKANTILSALKLYAQHLNAPVGGKVNYSDAWDELPSHPEHVPFAQKLCGMKKTVPCNICGKKFKRDDFMRQHRAAAHSKEEIATKESP